MSVRVQSGESLELGVRTVLFHLEPDLLTAGLGEFYTLYDVDVDDQRFLMMRAIGGGTGQDRTVVVLNAFARLAGAEGN